MVKMPQKGVSHLFRAIGWPKPRGTSPGVSVGGERGGTGRGNQVEHEPLVPSDNYLMDCCTPY